MPSRTVRLTRGAQSTLRHSQILAWADEHRRRTGRWPKLTSGPVVGTDGEKWSAIERALNVGCRGLRGGSSIARLLAEHRGVRNHMGLPHLSIRQVLKWADAHYRTTGQWPTGQSGPVSGSSGETWMGIQIALNRGRRGLSGGSSLAALLSERRAVRQVRRPPKLRERQILTWADEHRARTGEWPGHLSGAIRGAQGETWTGVQIALQRGRRGLPGGSSLARLLESRRGVPNRRNRPRLNQRQILQWADQHHARSGAWPTPSSGLVPEAPGETWPNLNAALLRGLRGLPRGTSLMRLIVERRQARHPTRPGPLTVVQVLDWAGEHHRRTGCWPQHSSGVIPGTRGETWSRVDAALKSGNRGLPAGSSLRRLLWEHCGVRNFKRPPPLSESHILTWARAHRARTGTWPTYTSGKVPEVPGEHWYAIDASLRHGYRGLEPGCSLARFLARRADPYVHNPQPRRRRKRSPTSMSARDSHRDRA